MTMQIRPKGGDDRFYSPDRDLAWVGVQLLRQAVAALGDGDEPAGHPFAAWPGREALARAAGAWADYVVRVGDAATEDEAQARRETLDAADPAALAVLAWHLGRITQAAVFRAMRDVTPLGQPPASAAVLAHEAARAARLLQPPRRGWQRFFRRP